MRKKGVKNRRKVILEEVLGVYYVKEAHYSNFSYYSGKTIDCFKDRERASEFVKALKYKVIEGEEILKTRGNK